MNQNLILDIILQALEFLIDDPEKLEDFCIQSGSTIEDIKNNYKLPHFQAALLDYFFNNQTVAFQLFEATTIDPKEFIKVRRLLPGADIELINL